MAAAEDAAGLGRAGLYTGLGFGAKSARITSDSRAPAATIASQPSTSWSG